VAISSELCKVSTTSSDLAVAHTTEQD